MERKLHFYRDLIRLIFMLDFVPWKDRVAVVKELLIQVLAT